MTCTTSSRVARGGGGRRGCSPRSSFSHPSCCRWARSRWCSRRFSPVRSMPPRRRSSSPFPCWSASRSLPGRRRRSASWPPSRARALAMGGLDALEKVQAEQARALQLDRALVESFTGGQLQANRKSNKFLMDLPLDVSQLDPLLDLQERAADVVGDEVRAQLAGNLPAPMALVMPILAAILLIALRVSKARIRPSGCCDRCGREVCRR